MIKEEQIQRIITETKKIWTCDICGQKAHTHCSNCEKDLCKNHSNWEDNGGDYPAYFCPDCYKKYRYFTDVIEPKLNKQYEEEYEKVMRNTSDNS